MTSLAGRKSGHDAQLCLRSWTRTSRSPVSCLMRRQCQERQARREPALAPRSTQGTPSARSIPSSTFRTGPVSGTMRGPVFVSLRQRINLIYCKRTIIFVSGERCNQDECGFHQSTDPPWTQLAPDGNAVARGASVRSRGEGRDESAGAGASLRCSFRGVTARGGAGTTATWQSCAGAGRSGRREVRSTIRCRWIALRFARHRERTGADRCRATAREPLSIRVRRRVRPSPSDAFADLKRRAR